MAEELILDPSATRADSYKALLPQLQALVTGEPDLVANVSNVMAALKYGFDFFWVGVYWVQNEELVLGPFQGPIACTRIQKGKGVCGTAWEKDETLIVANVDEFPGHIACSSDSKSEIVLPIKNPSGKIVGVLDVDSDKLAAFNGVDQAGLEPIAALIGSLL